MIISKTPLRISLIGGGTDFRNFYEKHGGRVISATIDKYVYVILKERYDDLIVLNYTQHEIVEKVDDIKHDLIRECMWATGIDHGVEITTLADIPSAGSGLGSSSAITVGLLNVMFHYMSKHVNQKTLAELACETEVCILGKPIGEQDQYGTAFGGLKTILFNKSQILPMTWGEDANKIGDNLFLHFTGITRDANKILSTQVNRTEYNIPQLQSMLALVDRAEIALENNNFDEVGCLIRDGWEIKKSLASDITNDKLNLMIDQALYYGAIGAKLTGAGGGGFLLSYVPSSNHDRFRRGMSGYRELRFNIDKYGSRIIFDIQ